MLFYQLTISLKIVSGSNGNEFCGLSLVVENHDAGNECNCYHNVCFRGVK